MRKVFFVPVRPGGPAQRSKMRAPASGGPPRFGSAGPENSPFSKICGRPGFRRQGIASALLGVFLRFGEAGHLAFLTLEVRASNAAARALYDSLGFRAAGRRRNYYEHPREDAIIMTKEFTHGTEAADEGTAAGGL